MHIKKSRREFRRGGGASAGIKKPLREGAGREAGLQFLKRPGRPSDCLVRRRAAMTFDGHLAPVRGLPDVGLHRNNSFLRWLRQSSPHWNNKVGVPRPLLMRQLRKGEK